MNSRIGLQIYIPFFFSYHIEIYIVRLVSFSFGCHALTPTFGYLLFFLAILIFLLLIFFSHKYLLTHSHSLKVSNFCRWFKKNKILHTILLLNKSFLTYGYNKILYQCVNFLNLLFICHTRCYISSTKQEEI